MKSFILAHFARGASAAHAPRRRRSTVKLGLIDIYSGGFAFIADSIRTGFQIAVDEANAAGGLKGRKFEVVTADMGGSVDKAVTEARRMILEEKIKYVTVGIHSGAAVAVGNLGKEYKVLVNGGFATTKRLTGEAGHDYVARANLSTVEIGRVMAEHLKSRPDIKRVAVIAPDYEYGQHFAADFIAGLKVARPDITVVRRRCTSSAPPTSARTSPRCRRSRWIWWSAACSARTSSTSCARRATSVSSAAKTQFFMHGLDLAKMGSLKDSLPANTHGHGLVSVLCHRHAEVEGVHRRVREAHEDLSRPAPPPVGYVAGKMLVEAIRKAGTRRRGSGASMRSARSQFEGPTGLTKVRACDNMAMYNFYVGDREARPGPAGRHRLDDIKAYNTETVARSCEDVMKARATGG